MSTSPPSPPTGRARPADGRRDRRAARGLATAGRRAAGDGGEIAEAAALITAYAPRFVLFVARGTPTTPRSTASTWPRSCASCPAGLVSPSTMTAYGARPDLRGVLMVGVSQSGGSPDLVRSLEVAREQRGADRRDHQQARLAAGRGRRGPGRRLAGTERAVAATKSYTAQLLALYLLRRPAPGRRRLGRAPLADLAEQVLAQDTAGRRARRSATGSPRGWCTTARGYSYPTAREAALKLMETSLRLGAQAFSGADLLHGPLAMIDPQVPVLPWSPGVGGEAMAPVLPRLAERGADVFCVGTAGRGGRAAVGVVLPDGVTEELSPLLEIIPFQQLAQHLAVARGGDPDAPRGLRKVTETL